MKRSKNEQFARLNLWITFGKSYQKVRKNALFARFAVQKISNFFVHFLNTSDIFQSVKFFNYVHFLTNTLKINVT